MATNPTTPANLVFKVKYGDNLKRITKSANNEPLFSNLCLLKSKIRECFAISNGQDFNLTYVDKEGDAVMLADDSDLHDVTVRQCLNPVRVNVKLINSSGNSKRGAPQRSEVKSDEIEAASSLRALRNKCADDTAPEVINVHGGVKCYACGKFTPKELWNGIYNNKCPNRVSLGIQTEARSLVEECNSLLRPNSATGAPFSHLNAQKSVEFNGYGSLPRGTRGTFPLTISSLTAQVEDITFPLGSKIAPNTPFTKIWRVWNGDSVTWPHGVQIRNVSASPGFAVVVCAKLEIPAHGLEANKGVDISMDLRTPSSPGTYYATWSLVPPPGFYFKHNQQISVSISVSAYFGSASAHNVGADEAKSKTLDNPVTTDVKTKSNTTIVVPKKIPIPESANSVARVGSGKLGKAVGEGAHNLEEYMMKELYEMGFYDEDMNLEILRSSNYDLSLSLDRLCDISMIEEEDVDGDDNGGGGDEMWI